VDIIGDIEQIIAAKRADTAFLFFTDGVTWKQRRSDLRKIVEYQNNGDITRIYTYAMADAFEADLLQLKGFCQLSRQQGQNRIFLHAQPPVFTRHARGRRCHLPPQKASVARKLTEPFVGLMP
jgi:hypothetical protein